MIDDPELQNGAGGDGGTPDPNAGAGSGGDESYFLEVDDRTRYKTAEEAVEGYRNAGQRIAELTPWQATAAEYGLTDPTEIAAYLDELAELRAQSQANASRVQSGAAATTTGAAAAATAAALDPNTPEGKEAAAIQWLQKNGVNAGLVNNEALTQLTERLDFLTQEAERVDNERFEQRMEYGRNILTQELKTAGIYPTDPKDVNGLRNAQELSGVLEDALTNWVNASETRVRQFHAGGEQLANLVKTGLQRILPALNVLRNSSGATIAATRTNANANRTRTVAAATGTRTPVAVKPRTTAILKPEDGITPEVHEAAWAAFTKARGDQA